MIISAICNSYKLEIIQGVHKTTDEYYIALFTDVATIDKDTTSYTGLLEEVANGNGYTTGGKLLEGLTLVLDNDVAIIDFETDPLWTSSTITARGCLIYNNSLVGKNAVGVIDFGGDYSSTNGEFKITFPLPTSSLAILRIV